MSATPWTSGPSGNWGTDTKKTTAYDQASKKPPAMPEMSIWDYLFAGSREPKMAAYQNEYNYWLWQQQNKYNEPSAQMSRYSDAGLNPALMYDKGTSGNAETPAPGVAPKMDSINPMSIISQYADVKTKLASAEKIQADADWINKWKGDVSEAQYENIKSKTSFNEAQLEDLRKDMVAKDIPMSTANMIINWLYGNGELPSPGIAMRDVKSVVGYQTDIVRNRYLHEKDRQIRMLNEFFNTGKWSKLAPLLSLLTKMM
jgi:signal recognition particle GTPase